MSKNIGIVCEFNPFHKGHEYLIRETRRTAGEDCNIICVMSGDFVQRGEPALYSKFARAEAACRCGADLVIELPLPWALSSAEGFARGAVSLLHSVGATHLSFGSESGETEELDKLARTLIDPLIINEIRQQLNEDAADSFASAREKVLAKHLGKSAELIRQPNNILAVEYLKAIYDLCIEMEPMTVKRIGSGHDEEGDSTFKSSSELRRLIFNNKDVSSYIPAAALQVYERENEAGRGRINTEKLELAILSRLRMLPEKVFDALPDSTGGAGKRLYKAVTEEATLDAVLAAAKTKRYALSRLRRMCMCAVLGIDRAMGEELPEYARVLSANERGCALLRELNDSKKFTVITKPAAVREHSGNIYNVFAAGASAHDFYVLANRSNDARKPGLDWKTSPKIVHNLQAADEKPKKFSRLSLLKNRSI